MVQIEEIMAMIDDLARDRRVPRNIRTALSKVLDDMQNPNEQMTVKLNSAISVLDEVSNDPNIPPHTRTQVWNIVSMLESYQSEA